MPDELQPSRRAEPWRPFPNYEAVVGGVSLRADGSMSWNGHDPQDIIRNRFRYFKSVDLDPSRAVGADQVHGSQICRVARSDAGRGILNRDSRVPATDGLVTNEPGIILTTLHADCAPVFYFDPQHHAIGLAHAGRRGILAGIAGNTVQRMISEFGSDPQLIRVAIGPTISVMKYEVETAVAEEFAVRFGPSVVWRRENHSYLDLVAALNVDLLEAGLNPSFIPSRPPCTASDSRYSSFRRDSSPVQSMLAWLCMA